MDGALGPGPRLQLGQLALELPDPLLACGGSGSCPDVLGGRLRVSAAQRAGPEPVVVGHPQGSGGVRSDPDAGQQARHRGGAGAGVLRNGGDQQRRQVGGDGRPGGHEQLPGQGDGGTVGPDGCGQQPGGLARRLDRGAVAAVQSWGELDERGEQCGVGRPVSLPPGAGQRQLGGGAHVGQLGAQPCDVRGRAFRPQGRGAEHGIERGVERGGGPTGFGGPDARDLAQVRTPRVRPRRDRQPAGRAAGLRRRHGRRVSGELVRPGQDSVAMALPGGSGGRARLGGDLPLLLCHLAGVVGPRECGTGSAVGLLRTVQHRCHVDDLLPAGPHRIGGGARVDAGQCVAIGSVHPVTVPARPQHRRIGQREGDRRGSRVPICRPYAFPDADEVAVEPPAVCRDPLDRVPHALLRGRLLLGLDT
jgi:hypothetical protein